MIDGYVSVWRKLLTSPILKNPKLLTVWMYCLLKATHKDYIAQVGWQEVPLKAGQFIFGRKQCAEETGLSEQTIRTCINKLIINQQITSKPTNRFSIITIVNWVGYQQKENKINQQKTSKSTTYNKTIKELMPDFDLFYDSYPKKKSPRQAEKTWAKLHKSNQLPPLAVILQSISEHKDCEEWKKDGGQYIPYPSTWLNDGGWLNVVKPIEPERVYKKIKKAVHSE